MFQIYQYEEENYDIKRNSFTQKMSNSNIDDEIDKAVDKFAEQLKIRLKKIVVRSEKQILRQYIASQKETAKASKTTKSSDGRKGSTTDLGSKVGSKKDNALTRRNQKKGQDYASVSESEYSETE